MSSTPPQNVMKPRRMFQSSTPLNHIENSEIWRVELHDFTFENCQLYCSVFDDCEITNSTLEGCNLYKCTLKNCRVSKSILGRTTTDRSFVTDNCEVVGGSYRDTQFEDCTVEKSKIRRSTIKNCKITQWAEISTSTITGGMSDGISFSNCEITQSIIRRSDSHVTKIEDCMGYKIEETQCDFDLRKLESKIRGLIFIEVLAEGAEGGRWAGEAPALIVALRCQPEMYKEAMQVLYKHQPLNVCYLPKYIPDNLYQNVQKLTFFTGFVDVKQVPEPLLVKSRVLEMHVICTDSLQPLLDIAMAWIEKLKTLQKLSVEVDTVTGYVNKKGIKKRLDHKGSLGLLNSGMGITAEAAFANDDKGWQKYVWKAEVKKTLEWRGKKLEVSAIAVGDWDSKSAFSLRRRA